MNDDSSQLDDTKLCISCQREMPAEAPSAECNDCLDAAERRSDAFFKKLKQKEYENEQQN